MRIHQTLGCHKGISDLIAVKKGVTAFIEIKTPKGELRPEQLRFSCEIDAHGGIYAILRSVEGAERLDRMIFKEGKNGNSV